MCRPFGRRRTKCTEPHSNASGCYEVSKRWLPSVALAEHGERRRRDGDLAHDLREARQEYHRVERRGIRRHNDRRARRNWIAAEEVEEVRRGWPRASVGQNDEGAAVVGRICLTTGEIEIVAQAHAGAILERAGIENLAADRNCRRALRHIDEIAGLQQRIELRLY